MHKLISNWISTASSHHSWIVYESPKHSSVNLTKYIPNKNRLCRYAKRMSNNIDNVTSYSENYRLWTICKRKIMIYIQRLFTETI